MNEVDAYIAQFDSDTRERLMTLRNLTKQIAPQATESISYGLIGYKLGTRPLVYFGGFAQHIGVYATPQTHEQFAQELATYKQGKGSVQFPLNQPLPTELIGRMIQFKRDSLSAAN